MFITFEGPEGGGKSTVLALLAETLRVRGREVLCTREPGAGELGKQVRELLLHGDQIRPETELLLFLADRSNHVAKIINPALADGKIVLCDRYADSTLVYQGYARDLDREFVKLGNRFATQGLRPDLTFLFDLPVELGLSRIREKDRLDLESVEFHQRVREGFLDLAHEEPKRWAIIDASKSPNEVLSQVLITIENHRRSLDEPHNGR